ncbi:Uncharacterised protein [Yersinia enterocolitica]|nr:Uncharacterised protein [Yersinia enterocolitica]CNE88354.1 Uncharacterised protein [Yersinia enterocolitica]VEB00298.1 Uncharacterised protein [Yersinia enterocolitica subsp. enterocolitica]VEF83744.1 Uncharacterised protein [Yersinia enterocolitica subsp. palearctica]
MAALRLLKKCPLRREQTDRKDAVKSSLMARAAYMDAPNKPSVFS